MPTRRSSACARNHSAATSRSPRWPPRSWPPMAARSRGPRPVTSRCPGQQRSAGAGSSLSTPADRRIYLADGCLPAAPRRPAAAAAAGPAVAARGEQADDQSRGQHGDDARDHRVPGPEQGGGEDPADDGGHDPDEDRHDDPDVLAARYDQARYRADRESDENPPDDDGKRECHDPLLWGFITVGFVTGPGPPTARLLVASVL